MNNQITAKQLKYTVAVVLLAGMLQLSYLFTITAESSWIVFCSGILIQILIVSLYAALSRVYPAKTICDMAEDALGLYVGKFVEALYIVFFFLVLSLNLRSMGNFLTGNMLPEVPILLILGLMLFVGAFAVRKGLSVIGAVSFFIFAVFVFMLILELILQIRQMRLDNFLPLLGEESKFIPKGILYSFTIPMGRTVSLLVLMGFVADRENLKKTMYKGILLGGGVLLAIVLRDTAVLGVLVGVLLNTVFETVQLLDLVGLFTRVEVIFILQYVFIAFIDVAVIFFSLKVALGKLFNIKDRKKDQRLVYPIGVALLLGAYYICSSNTHLRYLLENVIPYLFLIFQIALPLLILIIGSAKYSIKKRKSGKINGREVSG